MVCRQSRRRHVFALVFAPLGAVGTFYVPVIVTFAAIAYTFMIKNEPNSLLLRLSAPAATAIGVVLSLVQFGMIGRGTSFLDLSALFYLTASAMLPILLVNDVASVIGTIRKRGKKAPENGAPAQRHPAAALVICTACALAA